jgi:predicted NAD/FAD-dependent oxidoreductase
MALSKPHAKNIIIIGAGAAGMSCAATLAQHPEKFNVTVIDRMGVTGGQATSISLDKNKYGTDWMNDGVQGKYTFGVRPSISALASQCWRWPCCVMCMARNADATGQIIIGSNVPRRRFTGMP